VAGIRAAAVDPPVLDFGYVSLGRTAARTFVLSSVGEAPVTISEVELTFDSSEDFSITDGPERPVTLAAGETAEFEVTYAQAGPAGDQGAVFIQTDAQATPRLFVRCQARQKESPRDIHVDPMLLNFGMLGVNGEGRRSVSIANVGGTPLEVERIFPSPETSAEYSLPAPPALPRVLEASESFDVEVLYNPDGAGRDEGELVIASNAPNESEVRVALLGGGTDNPVSCLRIAPNPLDFGGVRRGETRTLMARLISCGVADLNIQQMDRSRWFGQALTNEFQVTEQPQWPVRLPTGAEAEVEITYEPRLAGPDMGHFVVHNDSPDAQARLEVRANGLPPRLEDVALHVQLEWDADNSDVDLHLIRPGGTFFQGPGDCYFSNPSPDWGVAGDFHDDPFLDVDNVRGFGPENINLETPSPGVYTLSIDYYQDSYDEDMGGGDVDTTATARIFVHGNLVHTGNQLLDDMHDVWDVATIDWPAGVVTPVNRVWNR